MNLRALAVFLWGCLIAGAAIAGEEHRTEIKIAIDGEGTEHQVFKFDSQDSGVDLRNLEIGDTETFTNEDGHEVTVTRNDSGFEFNVGGETVEVPDFTGDEHELVQLHKAHESENVVVEKHRKVHMIKTEGDGGVTIISGDEIDADTRARIEKVLEDAGKDGEVLFIDGSNLSGDERAHGKREVRIIKKEIDVTD